MNLTTAKTICRIDGDLSRKSPGLSASAHERRVTELAEKELRKRVTLQDVSTARRKADKKCSTPTS